MYTMIYIRNQKGAFVEDEHLLRHSLFASYRVWSLSHFTNNPRIPSRALVFSRHQDLKERPSGENCTFYQSDPVFVVFLHKDLIIWL